MKEQNESFAKKNSRKCLQFPKYLYLCTRKRKSLGYGVMVTLQILVLSFLVRIQVAQQIIRQNKLKAVIT